MKRKTAAHIARRKARQLLLVELAAISHPAALRPVSHAVKRTIARRVLCLYRNHMEALLGNNATPRQVMVSGNNWRDGCRWYKPAYGSNN